MAKPEQTEKATPKRREESRSRGQVPRSTELAGSVSFLAIVLVIHAFFAPMMDGLQGSLRGYFSRLGEQTGDVTFRSATQTFAQVSGGVVALVLVVFITAFIIGIVANVAQ